MYTIRHIHPTYKEKLMLLSESIRLSPFQISLRCRILLKSIPCAVCTLVLDLLLHYFDATTVTALTSTDP